MKRFIFASFGIGLALNLGGWLASANAQAVGALYTMDNSSTGNHVWVMSRHNAALSISNSYATGGLGLGTAPGLPSQGSLVLSADGKWLFVCNAGSGEISVFETLPGGNLQLTDKTSSGGMRPISLAVSGSLLYALNADGGAGSRDNITAFHFGCGNLTLLPESTRWLTASNTGPAQISFTRDGGSLVVTEKGTSMIDTWDVGSDGMATNHQVFISEGATPYGFAIGRGERLFVSEAAGGVANASSVSSYTVNPMGALTGVTASAPTHQTAACWLALSPSGAYIYTANAGAGTLSGFRVHSDGAISLLSATGVSVEIGAGTHPADLAFSHNGSFLFSLNNGNGSLSAFAVRGDGSLTAMGKLTGLPLTAAGLAGW